MTKLSYDFDKGDVNEYFKDFSASEKEILTVFNNNAPKYFSNNNLDDFIETLEGMSINIIKQEYKIISDLIFKFVINIKKYDINDTDDKNKINEGIDKLINFLPELIPVELGELDADNVKNEKQEKHKKK